MSPTRRGFLKGAVGTAAIVIGGGAAGAFKRPAGGAPIAPTYPPVTVVTDELHVPADVSIGTGLDNFDDSVTIGPCDHAVDFSEIRMYYDRVLLERALPNLVHLQFSQKRPFPTNAGKTIEFRKFTILGGVT